MSLASSNGHPAAAAGLFSTSHRLDGRVALVTGSSKGLGKAIAGALGAAGAKVALNYCHGQAAAESAFEEFSSAGYHGMLARADVTNPQDIQRLCDEIQSTLGPVDVLVCNATCDQPQKPLEEYEWDFFQTMLDFFVKSPVLLAQACVPHMKAQGWGRIINITSEVFQLGTSPFTAYVAAKGAQVGLSRSLATELAPSGITVNMVAPGWVPVERHAHDSAAQKAAYLAQIPAGRWGTPADIAAAVAYFASEQAGFVTGQTLTVNGGLTVM